LIEIRTVGRIYVKAPYELKESLKLIPTAKWEPKYRLWSFAATPAAALRLDMLCPDKTDDEFRELLAQAFEIAGAEGLKERDDLPQPEIRKNDSWKHQLQAYYFMYNIPAAMFYGGMGVGKSKVTVDLIINKGYRKVLIVCPKSVLTVWPKEFKKHAGSGGYDVLPLSRKSVAKRTEAAEAFLKVQVAKGNQAVIVANYDMAWREPFGSWALKTGFDLVVCDESQKIKAAGSKVSMYFSRLGNKVPHRLCLTGTPMPNSPLDAYGQYRFLDKGIFGTSFVKFRARYAQTVPVGNGGQMVVGYINQDELHDKFYSIAYHADRSVLDLPSAVHQAREVELSPKTQKIYDQLEKDFYAWVEEGKEVTVSNALVKLLRLQQVCSGFGSLTPWRSISTNLSGMSLLLCSADSGLTLRQCMRRQGKQAAHHRSCRAVSISSRSGRTARRTCSLYRYRQAGLA